MAEPNDYLANAERLLSEVQALHSGERSRSAATLLVVALEQMGEFVETLTYNAIRAALLSKGLIRQHGDRWTVQHA